MARFRKGTTDHDGDGKMGGSLKALTRFVLGTNDHDADGTRGGSLPKGDTTMAKTPARTAAKPRTAPKSTSRTSASAREQKAALEAEALAMTAAPDPIIGMTMVHPDDAPKAAAVKEARKAALEEQFGAADEKAVELGARRAAGLTF